MSTTQPRYLQIAHALEAQIARGVLRVGERVPSLRAFSEQQQVSMSTVLQAYLWLENRGFIEARPQSGFYVRVPQADLAPEPDFGEPEFRPTSVGISSVLHQIVTVANDPANFQLGKGVPGSDAYPTRKLNQITASILRKNPAHSADYQFPPEIGRAHV